MTIRPLVPAAQMRPLAATAFRLSAGKAFQVSPPSEENSEPEGPTAITLLSSRKTTPERYPASSCFGVRQVLPPSSVRAIVFPLASGFW